MRILVAYASKHGATQEIAERIGQCLTTAGHSVDVQPVQTVRDGELARYDAFVIGSATYMAHWRKEATAFVRRHQDYLSARPVWLFSSGPVGTEATDEEGNDLRAVTLPKEATELSDLVLPQEHRVFFGVVDPTTLGMAERAIRKLPAGRALLPEGDFRDWADIEGWTGVIAAKLALGADSLGP